MELDATVAAAAGGDRTALNTVFAELSPAVCGYLRTRGSDDPEGLTNEVFIEVLPKLSKVRGGWSGLRAFSFTVAHHRLIDERRRRARMPRPVEYVPEHDGRSSEAAETLVLANLTDGPLDLLELLPEDQRSMVYLRVVGELTTTEAARTLGISRRVGSRLETLALDTLKHLLRREPPALTENRPTEDRTDEEKDGGGHDERTEAHQADPQRLG